MASESTEKAAPMRKAVHFGAGNIGRGFIGLLLSKSGYEVTFVDVVDPIVEAIHRVRSYSVVLADVDEDIEYVMNVKALKSSDVEGVTAAIATSDIVTTAVGPNILKLVAEPIAQGLRKHMEQANYEEHKMHIIACENVLDNSAMLQSFVMSHLNAKENEAISKFARFPATFVDRIVPLQSRRKSSDESNEQDHELLRVKVEPFFEWAIDINQCFPSTVESTLKGVNFVRSLEPYIERKLFLLNTGHTVLAYLGQLKGYTYVREAVADPEIREVLENALNESCIGLLHKFPGVFEASTLKEYVKKSVNRYENPNLDDDLARVGRNPIRKLKPTDRLVKPAIACLESGTVPDNLCKTMAAAFFFHADGDSECAQLTELLREKGLEAAFTFLTQIPNTHSLYDRVLQYVKVFAESHSRIAAARNIAV